MLIQVNPGGRIGYESLMRTQVAIIGAGPAGLLLSHLLHLRGVDSIVLESQSRKHVEERIRAGVLEQGTVDLLVESGVGARLKREGLVHHGISLHFDGRSHRIDFGELTGGRVITVYAQQEVVKDLIEARLAAGAEILFEVGDVRLDAPDTTAPQVRYRHAGTERTIDCDFVAGCDGYHGVSRAAIPAGVLTLHEQVYPFAWLGILAETAPPSPELIYCHHERGFALFSMRTPALSRLYLQCAPDENLAAWPDPRIWEELHARLGSGATLRQGPVLQKGITGMRSFVAEPMRYGRLFLAGDAAHIVPPTGAKGLNLAVADVRRLSRAIARFYESGSSEGLERYSADCLRRVWQVQRFSWWMTALLHRHPGEGSLHGRLQLAELDHLAASRAAATALAENYVGLPFDDRDA
jgi:p-hydroxybenzoate 3-monooxygenase